MTLFDGRGVGLVLHADLGQCTIYLLSQRMSVQFVKIAVCGKCEELRSAQSEVFCAARVSVKGVVGN